MQKLGKTEYHGCEVWKTGKTRKVRYWSDGKEIRLKKGASILAIIIMATMCNVRIEDKFIKPVKTQTKTEVEKPITCLTDEKNVAEAKNESKTEISDKTSDAEADEIGDSKSPEDLKVVTEKVLQTLADYEIINVSTISKIRKIEEDCKQAHYNSEKVMYYMPTEEEREFLYKLVYAEAGYQSAFGQTLVANAIINRAINSDQTIIQVGCASGQFSPVKNGIPYIYSHGQLIPVTDDMISDELRAAVDAALKEDVSKELLKKAAQEVGISDPKYWENGVLYFYNPKACDQKQISAREHVKVSLEYGDHVFYSYWDKN